MIYFISDFPSRKHYICSEKPARLHMYVLQDSVCNKNYLQAILVETNLYRHSVKPELNKKQGLQKTIRFPAGKKEKQQGVGEIQPIR